MHGLDLLQTLEQGRDQGLDGGLIGVLSTHHQCHANVGLEIKG